MKPTAPDVKRLIAALPEDRRASFEDVYRLVRRHLPRGYEEAIAWGMVNWQVPLSVYPDTYNGKPLMYAALGNQKRHLSLYLMCSYARPDVERMLRDGFRAAGKRLDMGKACIRFASAADLPGDVIAQAIASTPMDRYVERARAVQGGAKGRGAARAKAATKAKAAKQTKVKAATTAKAKAKPAPRAKTTARTKRAR